MGCRASTAPDGVSESALAPTYRHRGGSLRYTGCRCRYTGGGFPHRGCSAGHGATPRCWAARAALRASRAMAACTLAWRSMA